MTGLPADRLERGKERLDDARESIKALCEPVAEPKAYNDFKHFFIGDVLEPDAVALKEPKRIALYRCTAAYTRPYANLANEMADVFENFVDVRLVNKLAIKILVGGAEATLKDGTIARRGIRKDRHTLLTAVASYPLLTAQVADGSADR